MPLVTASQLIDRARAERRGVGAFNVIQVEHAEAFVAAAARAGTGVVLQISQNAAKYHGGLEPIALATLAIARASSAPVVVHLDHAEDRALVSEAIELGMGSVMYDGSALDYEANVEATADVVREAHARGVFVEAELGKVGGKDGVHAPGVRTDPTEAVAFVAATGVDALAVAVGSSHAMTDRTASLDFERIAELRAVVPVPLVLHGSSGVADADLTRAVEEGMTKINISTHLNNTLTRALRTYLEQNPTVVDPRKYLGAGRDAMRDEVVRLLGVLNAA
ncbi:MULTISPECIES: class II fructose-bisphosphate aldolase [Oerskovia]|uniref:Fructose-bisphosphate aldolase n=1 Tax=Oerskovia enterophila TaxID=43678 RepID=A0A163S293_9CELL|nr:MULTISPECIES: class II fructose-bisphosphate aldolase [Oerskovia]KRC37679.1 fructose-bisphosphate aldolase [Oerskovia sp. Root22]KRD41074.1 fructose-bisphosphate aldolase [Oerskovia sp. Root918]KZM35939.1 putative fructose-bisphosphate aldolase [Oerskovia enterophila]OCI31362.1 putative fructose-bisphosphate aldolase [Oerskovia enterophila]